MATITKDAGGGEQILSQTLDFKKVEFAVGHYDYQRIQAFNPSQNSYTMPMNGTTDFEFKVPCVVHNLARSFLEFNVATDTGAAGGNNGSVWMIQNCFPYASEISYVTDQNVALCDIQYLSNYTQSVTPLRKSEEQLESNDYTTLMYSNWSVAPATQTESGVSATTLAGGVLPSGDNPYVSFREMKYVDRPALPVLGAAGSVYPSAGATVKIRYPLSNFVDSILAMDRNFLFPKDMILRIKFGPGSTCGWTTGIGTGVAAVDNPTTAPIAALQGNILITNLYLQLAVEQNVSIQNKFKQQLQSEGMKINVPYVNCWRWSTNGATTTQVYERTFTSPLGNKLRRVYWVPYNNAESVNTKHLHQNVNGTNISSFKTLWDGARLQQQDVDCTQYNDYRMMKPLINKTAIGQSIGTYQQNWIWCDSFDGLPSAGDEAKFPVPVENVDNGKDLSVPHTWSFQATTADTTFAHYIFAITQRVVTITKEGTVSIGNK